MTGFTGADTQIRTGDLILTKDALYRLSYISGATVIYYTKSQKNARGKIKKIQKN